MNKEELRAKFEKNVEFLQRTIPPDDVYIFCEQTFMAALFFLHKWSEKTNITEEVLRDPTTNKWVNNIMGLLACREDEMDISLDLNLDSVEDK
jgi:hypothetical protein